MNTYVVEGGIGKCTAFTALINKLTKKDKSPVQIYTPYIDCFAGNPNVKLVLEQSLPIQDTRIMASENIYYSEPYKSNFQFGKEHIIESYCKLHGVEFDVSMKPKLYTSHHAEEVKAWKDKNNIDKYILVQFSGGQSPIAYTGQYNNHNPNRNYPPFLAQQVVNLLKEEYPNVTIIDCTLPNEPTFLNTIKCDLHWSRIHELLKDSEGFISIDSCMNHFSASANKHGVVLWGSTRWIQFGYSQNTNLQFHMDLEWNESKYVDSDPRNIMIDPNKVVEEFKKLDKSKPVACATI
jgi:hypothetical protein